MVVSEREFAAELFRRVARQPVPDVRRHPAYDSLTAFSQQIYRMYEHAPHLEMIDEHLMQVTRYVETRGAEGIGRLIITMPPRHGKTLKVSRIYPAWHLGRNPHNRVMLVSYGQGLANKNSRAARNWIRTNSYRAVFPRTRLAPDSANVMEWDIAGTDGEGGASALGAGGGATGKGAHILIIDDPIKSREQAESETYREKLWNSYTDDLRTRLEPGGAILIMHTRWHEDDLVGRLRMRRPGEFVELNLPALAEENDPMGRAVGDALWPERYTVADLEAVRDDLGPYSWSALYQQRPQPAAGGILKRAWFERVRVVPETEKKVRYWDLAMSSKTSADYTVGLRMERGKDGNLYITDIARAQKELHDLPGYIRDVMLHDGRDVIQGFEMTGYMTRAVQAIAKDPQLGAFTIKGYKVESDKLTRVLPAAARAALGVMRVKDGDYVENMLSEFGSFPHGANDDQVDAFAGAYEMVNEDPQKIQIKIGTGKYA